MEISIYKRLTKVVTSSLISFMILYGATAVANEPVVYDLIELDANLVDDLTVDPMFEPADDWDTLADESVKGSLLGTKGPQFIVTTGRIEDPDNPGAKSYFKTGSSKDIQDISDWNGTGNSAPPKDEILNAGAAAYEKNGDLILAFFLDRYAQTGSATAGFWFTKTGVSYNQTTSTFTGSHTVGDVLVITDFSKGGKVGTVRVLEWVGDNNGNDDIVDTLGLPAAGTGNGPLQLRYEQETFAAGEGELACNLEQTVCAISNSSEEDAWDNYQSKAAPEGFYPSGSFIEGAINVSALLPSGTGCFAGFVAETRASDEVNSTLKDFVVKSFPVCGVEASIACVGTPYIDPNDYISLISTYKVIINSKGPGTIFDVKLAGMTTLAAGEKCEVIKVNDVLVSPTIITNLIKYDVLASLSGSISATVECDTFANPLISSVLAIAGSESGLSDLSFPATAVSCPEQGFSPDIALDKDCDGVHLVPPSGGGAYGILVNNTIILSVPANAKEALVNPIVVDNKMTNLTITGGTVTDANFVCSMAGVCTGILLPNETVELTGSWVPEGPAIITDPSSFTFTNAVSASGVGSISGDTAATPIPDLTATCGLCDTNKNGIPDLTDPETCPSGG